MNVEEVLNGRIAAGLAATPTVSLAVQTLQEAASAALRVATRSSGMTRLAITSDAYAASLRASGPGATQALEAARAYLRRTTPTAKQARDRAVQALS